MPPQRLIGTKKTGIDGSRIIWTPGESVSLDLVAEPLNEGKSYSIDSQDSAIAVRGSSHAGEFDIALLGGFIAGDWVVGGDFTGYLKDAGFRGEWIYTAVDENDQQNYFRALLSLDYAFHARWDPYIALEYLYNGLGTSDKNKYLKRLSDSSVQRVFQRGNAFNIGKNYLGLISRLTLSALITLQSTTLWNIQDSGVREFLFMTWSVSDNLDFLIGGDVGLGKLGTEFGGFSKDQAGVDFRNSNLYFAFLKWYF